MIELVEQQLAQDSTYPWLAEFQREQAAKLKAAGFPNRHWENWKYTNVSTLINAPYQSTVAEFSASSACLTEYDFIIQDGHLVKSPSVIDGIEITSFDELSTVQQEQVTKLLKQQQADKQPFVQLNTALLHSGLFIQVSKNIQHAKPLRIFYTHSQDNFMLNWCNLVFLEEGSQLILHEEFCSEDDFTYFNNVVNYFDLAKHAQMTYYKVQHESLKAQHIAHTQVHQAGSSQFHAANFSLGAKLARDDLIVNFAGEHASCVLDGLYLPERGCHIDHHTLVNHDVANCRSEELYKGILQAKSNAVFNGKVVVKKDAQKSEAHQTNHNLLLAQTAEVNTKPELEIYADDVICSHGATVGQLDQEALFYLRSRGIDYTKAQQLLTEAFAMDVIERITEPVVKQLVQDELSMRWREDGKNEL